MTSVHESKLVGFLEAVYAVEASDAEWLQHTLAAMTELCGAEHRYLGFFYDAAEVEAFKLWNLVRAQSRAPELERSWGIFNTLTEPAFVRSTFRSLYVGSARRTAMPYLEPVLAERERNGWGDFYYLNGLDPTGLGCLLTLGSRSAEFAPRPEETAVYRRLAAHLGAAYRCRRRLSPASAGSDVAGRALAGAEAILDPSGRLIHAEGVARDKSQREQLTNAAAALVRARARGNRQAGMRALEAWRPLTGARWTLVDSFEESGRRYIVARENQAESRRFYDLTDRERQVVVHAVLGMTNKQIAYALGISNATVRVLMARAAARLGVRSRKEVIAHPLLRSQHHS